MLSKKNVYILILFLKVLGQLPPRKIAPPPTLILTLTLTGGNFPRGQLSGHHFEITNNPRTYYP